MKKKILIVSTVLFVLNIACSRSDSVHVAQSRETNETIYSICELFKVYSYELSKENTNNCNEEYYFSKESYTSTLDVDRCNNDYTTIKLNINRDNEVSGAIFKVLYFDNTIKVGTAIVRSRDSTQYVYSKDDACSATLSPYSIEIECRLAH